MNNDDDPDDLRDLKRTRDKESKKTQKQIKRDQDENKNEYCNEDEKNEHTGSTTGEAHGITMIARPSLNKRAITIKAQHSLGGESIQTGELMVASNGTMKNRNTRRFYSTENVSAFSETTPSPWNRTFQGLFSWIFQSPVNRESILIIEDVVRRGCRLSLVMIALNYTNAQICFSTLQEEFTAGDESLDLIQAAGDNSHGLLGRSFRNFDNAGSILIIGDATRRRRLILATTPLSYLNGSRIFIFASQEAFSPQGVSLNLTEAAEDNVSRAVIVRIQPGALIPLEVLRIRCQPYSMPHDSDGKQSQEALHPLRSRKRPRDLSDLNPRSPASVLASPVNVQTNMATSATRAKEWSCAIPGRYDSACGSAPYPKCKMKAKGPSSELRTSKRNTTHSANLRFERNKDLVNMDAALKAPRQMVHGYRVTVTKGDDEMYVSGTIAVHCERSPRTHTLLKYPTQCTDTEGHAVTCHRKGRYETACQAESEDDGIQGESYRQPVMETGWEPYNICEDARDKKIVDGTNTSGNSGGVRRRTTGVKEEKEVKLGIPVQCEEDLYSVHHNASGHMTHANGDPDLGSQGGVRRRPVSQGVLRMHRSVLYAQCEEDLRFEYTWKLDEDNRRLMRRLLCPSCRALPWSVVLIPCGHLLCSYCYQGQLHSCPICRHQVYTSSHVLLS